MQRRDTDANGKRPAGGSAGHPSPKRPRHNDQIPTAVIARPHKPIPARVSEVERHASEVYQFLRKRTGKYRSRYVSRTLDEGDDRPVTAYLMNGYKSGQICVEEEDYDQFLDMYARDIERHIRHYISEQRSAIFRMHVDADFCLDECSIERFPDGMLLQLARILIYETRRFFPSNDEEDDDKGDDVESEDDDTEKKNQEEEERGERDDEKDDDKDEDEEEETTRRRTEKSAKPTRGSDRTDRRACSRFGTRPHPPLQAPLDADGPTPEAMPTSCLPDECFELMVLDSPAKALRKKRTDDGEEVACTKLGVHFVFPNMPADAHRGLALREGYLLEMESVHGPRKTAVGNSWRDVIDQGVYLTSGLRLPYSFKTEICAACRNAPSRRASCGECEKTGHRDDPRAYAPRFCLDGLGREDREAASRVVGPRSNIARAVRLGSIRMRSSVQLPEGWRVPAGVPDYQLPVRRGRGGDGGGVGGGRKTSTGGSSMMEVPIGSPLVAMMLDYVREMHPRYESLEAVSLVRNRQGTWYGMDVRGVGDRWCLNLDNREHTSCHVYFVMTPRGLHQRCRCLHNDKSDRLHGRCSTWRSHEVEIDDATLHAFFDDASAGGGAGAGGACAGGGGGAAVGVGGGGGGGGGGLDARGSAERELLTTIAMVRHRAGGGIGLRSSTEFARTRVVEASQSTRGGGGGGAAASEGGGQPLDMNKLFPVSLEEVWSPAHTSVESAKRESTAKPGGGGGGGGVALTLPPFLPPPPRGGCAAGK
jgi:hypothetical protein